MEVGKTAVKIEMIGDEVEEEEFVENRDDEEEDPPAKTPLQVANLDIFQV